MLEYKKLHTTHIYGMNSPYKYQKLLMDKWMKPNHKITEIQKLHCNNFKTESNWQMEHVILQIYKNHLKNQKNRI